MAQAASVHATQVNTNAARPLLHVKKGIRVLAGSGGFWRGCSWLTVALEPGTLRPAPSSLMMIPDLRRARPPPPGALGLSGPPDGPARTHTHMLSMSSLLLRQRFRQCPAMLDVRALTYHKDDIKTSRSASSTRELQSYSFKRQRCC